MQGRMPKAGHQAKQTEQCHGARREGRIRAAQRLPHQFEPVPRRIHFQFKLHIALVVQPLPRESGNNEQTIMTWYVRMMAKPGERMSQIETGSAAASSAIGAHCQGSSM